ncbi:hypothetical protein LX16_0176 [Stackebrandtia albiflava]|uniref:Knr4/Smi1-like domain-containing protein n=1 Tax=Stackebrandtia albiflava TaxID=406432 RepID=A0A562V9F6_9ACTN|nr:SMI1/KNR4 family protein [Stackebrandtia albiflava]TWJ14492.1 hypothetical protein LX16_0176 [Stackebrandtia albiflava]
MWSDFVAGLDAGFTLCPPADPAALAGVADLVGGPVPDELAGLWRESDGLLDRYGTEIVWPWRRVVCDNLEFRSAPDFVGLYRPFDSLLFFGDAGNGDQFAFPTGGDAVWVWDHEDDDRREVASGLRDYLRRTATGDDWYHRPP